MKKRFILPLLATSLTISACSFFPWFKKKASSSEPVDPNTITKEQWEAMTTDLALVGIDKSFKDDITITIAKKDDPSAEPAVTSAYLMGDNGRYVLHANDDDEETFYDVNPGTKVGNTYEVTTVELDRDEQWVGETKRTTLSDLFLLYGFFYTRCKYKDMTYNESKKCYEAKEFSCIMEDDMVTFENLMLKFYNGSLMEYSVRLEMNVFSVDAYVTYSGTFDWSEYEVVIPQYVPKDNG